MNERRKKIILSEIDYWKRNSLLPDHYCDFLSTLYTGGETEEKEDHVRKASILHKENKRKKIQLSSMLGMSLVLATLIYFINDLSSVLLGAIGVVILLGYATFKSVRKANLLPFVYVGSAFLLLLMSLKLWSLYFSDQPMLLIGLLILNCIMWLFTGRLLKLLYFTLSGSFGLLAIIFFTLFNFN